MRDGYRLAWIGQVFDDVPHRYHVERTGRIGAWLKLPLIDRQTVLVSRDTR